VIGARQQGLHAVLLTRANDFRVIGSNHHLLGT
jgi:hypothetical protein